MGRGPRRLTPEGWRDLMYLKDDKQLYWFLRHLGYTRPDIKASLIKYNVDSKEMKGLSFLELIQNYKSKIIDFVVNDIKNNFIV